jgi:ABC-2 type transport system ATP-binding protein
VVAVDTPQNLTARLRGSETMFLQVAGPADAVQSSLAAVVGVTRVTAHPPKEGLVDVEVDSESGRDVRRELAAAVVTRGWGLLELRPMRMSLEDIFLSLTTEESATDSAAHVPRATDDASTESAPEDTSHA